MAQRLVAVSKEGRPGPLGPCRWTVISRLIGEDGWPVFDRHTLEESCRSEEQAMAYGRHRASEGRWVEVYLCLARTITE